MVVCLSGKHRHVAVGEPKFEYLALIIYFCGKKCQADVGDRPKVRIIALNSSDMMIDA